MPRGPRATAGRRCRGRQRTSCGEDGQCSAPFPFRQGPLAPQAGRGAAARVAMRPGPRLARFHRKRRLPSARQPPREIEQRARPLDSTDPISYSAVSAPNCVVRFSCGMATPSCTLSLRFPDENRRRSQCRFEKKPCPAITRRMRSQCRSRGRRQGF